MAERLRVLVVDDEVLAGMGTVYLVEDAGHQAFGPAHSCDEAVELAAAVAPHVVLMDVNLGEDSKDGVVAAAAIREKQPVEVIYVTAYSEDPAVRPRLEATGPLAILGKPVDERLVARELARLAGALP